METKNRKYGILIIIVGAFIVFLLYMFFVPNTLMLKSDDDGVEFIYKDHTITDVIVDGPFLYGVITSYPQEEIIRDANGNVIEKIQTYNMEATFSIRQRMNMKVNIETSKDIIYTYVFKFADKDVTITNGKVVK